MNIYSFAILPVVPSKILSEVEKQILINDQLNHIVNLLNSVDMGPSKILA
jgi:hypothetical protein